MVTSGLRIRSSRPLQLGQSWSVGLFLRRLASQLLPPRDHLVPSRVVPCGDDNRRALRAAVGHGLSGRSVAGIILVKRFEPQLPRGWRKIQSRGGQQPQADRDSPIPRRPLHDESASLQYSPTLGAIHGSPHRSGQRYRTGEYSTLPAAGEKKENVPFPHADQFPLWQAGESIPIPWLQAEVIRSAKETLRRLPG